VRADNSIRADDLRSGCRAISFGFFGRSAVEPSLNRAAGEDSTSVPQAGGVTVAVEPFPRRHERGVGTRIIQFRADVGSRR
jgi:hypothetical protein